MSVDLKLEKNKEGYYDIAFGATGDFELVNSFETADLVSLLTDKRVDRSEIQQPERRRGWWADEISELPGDLIGSKLWLLEQSRIEDLTLNKAKDFIQDCFNWYIAQGYLKTININVAFFGSRGMSIEVIRERFDNKTESRFYYLWENYMED